MRKQICAVAVVLALVPSMAMAARQPAASASGSSCLANMEVAGGFTTGKQYLASQDHEGVPYPEAFRKTVAAMEAEGLQSVSPNERTGYIAADNPVRGGTPVPVRVTVRRQDDSSIRVEVRFSTKGGMIASKKSAGEVLCRIADAASM